MAGFLFVVVSMIYIYNIILLFFFYGRVYSIVQYIDCWSLFNHNTRSIIAFEKITYSNMLKNMFINRIHPHLQMTGWPHSNLFPRLDLGGSRLPKF